MGEGLTKKLSPNLLKGAAAAVAIGSVAVPAVEVDATTPIVASADGRMPALGNQAVDSTSVHVDSAEELMAVEARHKTTNHRKRPRIRFTGYEVKGSTSTFGWPTDGYNSNTADGGSTDRACIAIRNDSTLDHEFQVTVLRHHIRYQADMPQCDWGPAAWTGRAVDITGLGVMRLHLNPWNYPTAAWGIARELSTPKTH